MQLQKHGGDIYAEDLPKELLDFSASINPLGMPKRIRKAALDALEQSEHYPDPFCRELRSAIAQREQVCTDDIFCGGGAADVLFRLFLALKPKKLLLPVPTFGEYAQAAGLAGCEVIPFPLSQENQFDLPEDFWNHVTSDIDVVLLCNPNNPTGRLIPRWLVKKGMEHCAQTGTVLIVDECFHDFPDKPEENIMTEYIANNPHLILLRSFTKMYAMPGIRIGYCLSSNHALLERMYDTGAPWSVSVIAQKCGIAAAQDTTFAAESRAYLSKERKRLEHELEQLGFTVISGTANYILFRSELKEQLYLRMKDRGFLLRSCASFNGLDTAWYRIAVRTEQENQKLLDAFRQVLQEV